MKRGRGKSHVIGNNNKGLVVGNGNLIVTSTEDGVEVISGNNRVFAGRNSVAIAGVHLPGAALADIFKAHVERKKKRETKMVKSPPEGTEEKEEEDGEECVVCMERKQSCIALPCGHNKFCVKCSRTMCDGKERGEVQCPICNRDVKEMMKVF